MKNQKKYFFKCNYGSLIFKYDQYNFTTTNQ